MEGAWQSVGRSAEDREREREGGCWSGVFPSGTTDRPADGRSVVVREEEWPGAATKQARSGQAKGNYTAAVVKFRALALAGWSSRQVLAS